MNKNKYKRLSRAELLKLLIEESEKSESLEKQLKEAREELADRELKQNNAGSIAEAALALNSVFLAAEAACVQYMENIERLSGDQERICAQREADSRREAAKIVADAMDRAKKLEAATQTRCEKIIELTVGDITRFRENIARLTD